MLQYRDTQLLHIISRQNNADSMRELSHCQQVLKRHVHEKKRVDAEFSSSAKEQSLNAGKLGHCGNSVMYLGLAKVELTWGVQGCRGPIWL